MKDYWVFGGVVSVIFHVVLLWAVFSFGGGQARESVEAGEPATPAVERVETEPVGPSSVRPIEPLAPEGGVSVTVSYTVKSGDNLSRLAKSCGATFSELAELNGTTVEKLANLRIGQVIKLPAKGE